MFDLPDVAKDPIHLLADWVELETLAGPDGTLGQASIASVLRNSGVIGDAKSDPPDQDLDLFGDAVDMAPDDPAEQLAEEVLAVIESRARLVGERYIWRRVGDLVERTVDNWERAPCALAIVLMAMIVGFDRRVEAQLPGLTYPRVFEKIVQASLRGLHAGASIRFGVPREEGWPADIDARIHRLGDEFDLRVENLAGKTSPHDGDRTLDVASRLAYCDDGPGTVMFLTQCATGRQWNAKRAEPIEAKLSDLLVWNAVLVRAVAVPWWMAGPREYERQFREFNRAVILDRPRLLAGEPDRYIDGAFKPRVVEWCRLQLEQLPRVS